MPRPRRVRGHTIRRGHSTFDRPLFHCTRCVPGADMPECPEIGRLFWYHTSAAGPHAHRDRWEFAYFPDGHRSYRHRDRTGPVPPRCLLVCPPGTVHGEGPQPGLTQDMYWFQLQWSPKRPLPGLDRDDDRVFRRRLREAARLGPLPMTDTYPRDFYHLLCNFSAQAPYVRVKGRSLMHALLCMMLDGVERLESKRPSAPSRDGDLDPAIELMRRSVADPPSLRELGAACGLSERRFRTRFQQAHRMAPSDYQLRLRVRHAMELLEDKELSIADAAAASGFGSAQYFATVFKRMTEMTPSFWRMLYHKHRHRSDPDPGPIDV